MILRVYVNETDITESVQMKSVKIQSATGNRRNTASFIVNDYTIAEAQKVEIFRGSILSSNISAGVSSFSIDDSATDLVNNVGYFLRHGDRVILGYRTANEERVTIDTVVGNTVTIVGVTARSHTKGDLIGEKVFAGVTLKNPREEIGRSEMMTYSVDASDYSTILDAQNVVDTWEGVNAREILSRIVYLYSAVDASVTVNACESLTGLTYSGVAVAPTLDSTDKVYQNNSINIGASGAGSGTYTFTFSAINLSLMDKARLWIKSPAIPSSYISAMTYRIVDVSGDSYTWPANLGAGGWGYDSGDFSDAVVSGSVDLTNIVKFEILFTAIQAISIGTFKIDHILATKGGFTLKNTAPGNVIFADVRSQYKKPTVLIEDIAKANGFFWYVDSDKDLHFFSAEDRTAPETLTDLSTNFNKLKISADITNLRNTQTIRGGMAPEESIYTQIKVLDGKETSYRLDYPPKDLTIHLSTDNGVSWGSPRTVGIENIVDETSVDFVMNFTEKTVRNASIALQVAGTLLKMEYYPYKDIRVKRRDQVSIDRMKSLLGGDGIFDGPVINDASIRTFDDARSRAKAELTAYSNPVLTATFETERDGLEIGQILTITSTKYGVDSGFVIQKITASQKDNFGGFLYSITAGSTLYGLTEFFQYLLKKSSKAEIDVNELVDVVTTVDETLVMGDALTYKVKSAPFFVTPPNPVETLRTNESAWYEFDGNGNDSTGNGNTATAVGAVTYGEDVFGKYVEFNGDYNFATGLGAAANLGIGNKMNYTQNTPYSWSVTFSLLTLSANNGSGIFGSGFDNSIYVTSAGTMSVSLRGATNVFIGVGASGYWASRLGEIHTVAFDYDEIAKKAYVYLDGVLQNIGGTAGPATFLCNDWNIGDFGLGGGNMTSNRKKIYSARVYSKRMTDLEALWIAKDPIFDINGHFDRHTHLSGNLKFGGGSISAINGADQYVTDYFGDMNSGYSFDGNDLITQNGFFAGMGQEFTIHAMIYPTTISGGTRRILISSNDRLGLHIDTSWRLRGYVYDTTYREIISPGFFTLNSHFHVGLAYKANTLDLYIDGALVNTMAVTGPIVTATDVYVGNWSSLAQGFIGKIDEWGFYPVGLDAAGMLELYKRCTIANDAYADFCIAT